MEHWRGISLVFSNTKIVPFFIICTILREKGRFLKENGGRLGEAGSTKHLFNNCGIIHIDKEILSEEKAFEIAINLGAKDCVTKKNFHEIITKKEDFYKVRTELEKQINVFLYSAIEWRPINSINLNKDQSVKINEVLNTLEELDDVQNIYINVNTNIE